MTRKHHKDDGGVTLAERLAEFVVSTPPEAIPAEAIRYARGAVIDTLAVAIAGTSEPASRVLRDVLPSAPSGSAGASVWGTFERHDPATAALLNGTAGHALDFDDVSEHIHGHPSVVLVPALVAMAEVTGASGREILEAYVLGYEVQAILAAGMQLRRHFAAGWHSTSSIAGVGAAAAVCRLVGATVQQTMVAIGLAVSMAGGSRENFGSDAKPLHAGMAARDAVLAAQLATRGFSASSTTIEGAAGYFAMFYPDEPDYDAVFAAIERPWSILRFGLTMKRYPCCYNTSRLAQAALDLSSTVSIDGDKVASIAITVEPGGLDPLKYPRPESGLEGKFSAEYVAAAALLDGELGFSTFTDDQVRRPEATALVAITTVVEADVPPLGDPEWDEGYAVVEVVLDDGTRHARRCDDPPGHWRRPLDDSALLDKVADCLRRGGSRTSAASLIDQANTLDTRPFAGFHLEDSPAAASGA